MAYVTCRNKYSCFFLTLKNFFSEKIKNANLTQIEDFKAEVQVMVNLKPHPNIVLPLGACTQNEEELCLVTGKGYF